MTRTPKLTDLQLILLTTAAQRLDGSLLPRKKGELLDPVRVPREELEQKRREQGPRYFNAEYQQNPVAGEGSLINLDWFERYDEAPPRHAFQRVVQSWGTASTDRIVEYLPDHLTPGLRVAPQLAFVNYQPAALVGEQHIDKASPPGRSARTPP